MGPSELLTRILAGKRQAFFLFAGVELILGFVLAVKWPGSMTGFAAMLAPINLGLFGGGMWVAHVESRNGSAPSSSPSAPGSKLPSGSPA